jgi:hypothetical protein
MVEGQGRRSGERMPRGIPHGYFNKSDKPTRALFWVSPAGQAEDLFNALHELTDVAGSGPVVGRPRGGFPAAGG